MDRLECIEYEKQSGGRMQLWPIEWITKHLLRGRIELKLIYGMGAVHNENSETVNQGSMSIIKWECITTLLNNDLPEHVAAGVFSHLSRLNILPVIFYQINRSTDQIIDNCTY